MEKKIGKYVPKYLVAKAFGAMHSTNLSTVWFSKILSRSRTAKLKIPPIGPSVKAALNSLSQPARIVMSSVFTST